MSEKKSILTTSIGISLHLCSQRLNPIERVITIEYQQNYSTEIRLLLITQAEEGPVSYRKMQDLIKEFSRLIIEHSPLQNRAIGDKN